MVGSHRVTWSWDGPDEPGDDDQEDRELFDAMMTDEAELLGSAGWLEE